MTDEVPLLEIARLRAGTSESESDEILHGIDLEVGHGEVHALMGPNGSGKSTLGHVLAGRSGYRVTGGTIALDGEDLLALDPHERARRGLFVAFQYPVEVPGVSLDTFLDAAAQARGLAGSDVSGAELVATAERLGLEPDLGRALNEDMSGGEKKRSETLQLSILGAKLAVLDEIDSGLDVDGIRQVASEVLRLVHDRGLSVVLITHYVRILRYIPAQFTHVLLDGRIVESGGPELADELERSGYEELRQRAGLGAEAPVTGDDIFSL